MTLCASSLPTFPLSIDATPLQIYSSLVAFAPKRSKLPGSPEKMTVLRLLADQMTLKAMTDKLTRFLVFLGAAARMMYNALWYFSLLMLLAGIAAIIHDFRWLHGPVKHREEETALPVNERQASTAENETRVVPEERSLNIGGKFGLLLILLFLVSFVIMVLRDSLRQHVLAGTIIFGGGPVVIPLLREYVVAENWVFPGPKFNFVIHLGGLTAINGGHSSATGAVLGFMGIFAPGLVTIHGTMGVWNAVRGWRWVKSDLRGVNAAAVGLIYTAVYRVWQIGYIDEGFQQGTSLAVEL
ncbi:hypothetical protein B0J13DRAFT_590121 [Dactylonectria estremocensis]|uniref:Uncharacterized protein n=1 Tax=Dactylonectria estremocensis TaxID=1079267 RepID=A0A9P9DFJ8_9HYPO|nr:hypothetical protein B0J13DRAFT_590121 [Dactylonectria estremocensis]